MQRITKILKRPQLLFLTLGHRGVFNWMGDKAYLKIAYWCAMGKKLNIDYPKTYNEKLQWLKLYNRDPLYIKLVDKYAVREYVAKTIGEDYLIPLLGDPWQHFDEVDFDMLPEQFVLKCTHDSGGLVICKDKSKFNKSQARMTIQKCLKHNFFYGQREWPYKGVKPQIIAEQYMEDSNDKELRDYKFFVFDGEPRILFVATDRGSTKEETKFDFFDMDFSHLQLNNGHPNSKKLVHKPKAFEEMKLLSRQLANGLPHVRVDFYEVDGKVYFGEMTFYHWSGFVPFEPAEWDKTFGDWIDLSTINRINP